MQDIPGWTGCPVLHKRLGLHVQVQCWSSESPGSLLVPAQPALADSRVLDMKPETQQQKASAYSPVIFLGQTLKLLQQPEASTLMLQKLAAATQLMLHLPRRL